MHTHCSTQPPRTFHAHLGPSFTVAPEVIDQTDAPHTPIRELLIVLACAVLDWAERKSSRHFDWDENYEPVQTGSPTVLRLIYAAEALASRIFQIANQGSRTQWYFCQEFPPHIFPEYHDLPPFGTYPLAKN